MIPSPGTETMQMKVRTKSLQKHRAVLKCLLKWGISLFIVTVLIAKTDFRQMMAGLADYQFDPSRFCLGFLFCGLSVLMTLLRWQSLLHAFRLRVPTADVLRIGLFSYALNLLALGSLGGDVGRAFLITKKNAGQRSAAVLSVAADRMIGLYAMFFIAFVFVLSEKLFLSSNHSVQLIAGITAAGTILIPVGLAAFVMLIGGLDTRSSTLSGRTINKARNLVSECQGQYSAIFRAFLISLLLRMTTALGIYFLGTSLIGDVPGLRIHLLAVSMALLTGCLPLPLNGLGAMESVLEFVFQTVSPTLCPPGYGIAVALLYRMFLIAVGTLGAIVFGCESAFSGTMSERESGPLRRTVLRHSSSLAQ